MNLYPALTIPFILRRVPTYDNYFKPGTYRREHPKVGRNEPCLCGSGKKYKRCCLEKGGDTREESDCRD